MKLFVVLAAVTLAQAAKLDRVYLPPNAQASAGSGNFLQTPHSGTHAQDNNAYSGAPSSNAFAPNAYSGASSSNAFAPNAYAGASTPNAYGQNAYSGFEARPERAQAALERNAAILRQDNSNDGETYSYAYETENGIYAEESGVATNGVQAQGGYSYTGDDGVVYSVRYTADENGFVPQGDHLPTPPPIPEEILKALEQNARDEAAGIYDDGSYSDAKDAPAGKNQQQYYNSNAQPINYNDDSVVTNVAPLPNSAARNPQYSPAGNNYNRNVQPINYKTDSVVTKVAPLPNSAARNSQYSPAGNNQQYYNRNVQPVNYKEDSVITKVAPLPNSAARNSQYSPAGNNQQYYNRNVQPVNYKEDSVITKVAPLPNSGARNSVEKAYLPPFAQRSNNQRNGNYNARTGYRY